MEIIWIATHLVCWVAGIASGMYFSSQIEKHINERTKK
jgi:uncharacterized protein YneF (UPF0154 family)